MWGVSTRFQPVAGGSRALQGPPRGSRGLQGAFGGPGSRDLEAWQGGGGGGGQAEVSGVEGVFKGI